MITFQKIAPEEIDSLPKLALSFLEKAHNRTPASAGNFEITLHLAKNGNGNIYLIYAYGVLTGACYLLTYNTKHGKVVSPTLVGGHSMKIWHDAFYDFVNEFAKKVGAIPKGGIRWIGRDGWQKKFPKGRVIGVIMEHDLDYLETH